jgi:hypothetical protein
MLGRREEVRELLKCYRFFLLIMKSIKYTAMAHLARY